MDEFEAREAAALLDQATRDARRSLDRRPPLIVLFGAVIFLVAFGGVWWSVRHQHPYHGPAGWSLGLLYGIIVVWAVTVVRTGRRATSGVGGRSIRRARLEGAAFAVIWVSVYVFQEALHHAGASAAIAYGIYPATAPFIIVGSAAAARSAALENWREVALTLVLVVIAVGASFAGAAAVWLTMGIGLSVLLVLLACVEFWQQRAAYA
jgi:hypothetical protein